jgi:hypothetical protein
MLNSSRTQIPRTLARVSAGRAESFLKFLSNLPDKEASVKKFVREFFDLSPKRTLEDWSVFVAKTNWEQRKESPFWPLPKELGQLREIVRRVWKEPDLRTREWIAYGLRYYEMAGQDFRLVNPEIWGLSLPPPTPFEQCLLQLGKSIDRTRYCENPSCPAPYFFARRRSQRYCSDGCSQPAQREYKRRWWDEHGNKWRRKRKKARRKPKR